MPNKPHTLDEINEIIWDIVTESVSLGIDSRPGDLREKKMQVADQAKASILDWVVAELEKVEIYDSPDMTQEALRKQIAKLNKEREGNDEYV